MNSLCKTLPRLIRWCYQKITLHQTFFSPLISHFRHLNIEDGLQNIRWVSSISILCTSFHDLVVLVNIKISSISRYCRLSLKLLLLCKTIIARRSVRFHTHAVLTGDDINHVLTPKTKSRPAVLKRSVTVMKAEVTSPTLDSRGMKSNIAGD